MSRIPTIPDFGENLIDINASLRTVKQGMEILGGLRQSESLGSPLMFVQGHPPRPTGTMVLQKGDLWINDANDKLHYWNGNMWRPLQ